MKQVARSFLTSSEMAGIPEESRALASDLAAALAGDVRFDGWSRSLYSTDASLYQIQPIGVVVPRNSDDVQAAVEIAGRHGAPILARGSGSSLAGQAVGTAVILDCTTYLDRILSIEVDPSADAATASVTVQPGITVAALNRALAPLGLMLGPDPASAERASVGGSIANNASGSHSILYGMMADHVRAVDVVLAGGSPAHFEALSPEAFAERAQRGGLEGRIYASLPAIAASLTPSLLEHWPRHWRRASGYNLDRLAAPFMTQEQRAALGQSDRVSARFRPGICDPAHMEQANLAQLIAGSEGTLAVITATTLGVVRKPPCTGVAVIHFSSVIEACAATTTLLEVQPSAVELLDRQLMELARRQPEWARRLTFIEGDPEAVLLVEFYGQSSAEVAQRIDDLERFVRAHGLHGAFVRVTDSARQADIWAVRKAGLNLLMSRRGDFKPVPGIEDVSVPPDRLAEYLERVFRWCGDEKGVQGVAVYAHASAGCLHVRPLVNVKTVRGVEIMQAMAEMATALCAEFGGVLSGEHGDGLSRSAMNERLFGPEIYEGFRRLKQAFDPANQLNPGKIVDGPPITENLRMGADYHALPMATVYDWGDDGDFAGAIEMCNGAGVCRKTGSGVMCPSFMATRNEADSTRGRANALRNALAGRIPREELFGSGMDAVMDLCLGCKACKSECPSSVDMARIKSEYLVHAYHAKGLPVFNRLMGWLPTLSEVLFDYGRPLVSAVNAALGSRIFHSLQPAIGIAPERTLPRFAPHTFADAFHRARPMHSAAGREVILFHDTWTNYYEPEIGMAAVLVLEALNLRVRLAEGRACCGRPLITGGQADKARAWVDHNVALLAPFAAQGTPIVGIEPSCILTLRDEYPALASDRARARLVAGAARTLEEVVMEYAPGDAPGVFSAAPENALLHGHCHTRAIVGNEPSVAALRLAGYSVEVIADGCCGMAGDFGYEKEHYALSRTIGEDRMLPAVRAAREDTVIVASGTSCRHQIADFSGRRSLHLAQALARRLIPPAQSG